MKAPTPSRQAALTWTLPCGESRQQAATVVGLDEKTVRLNIGEELPLFQRCRIALLDAGGSERLTAEATVHFLRGIRGEKRLSCRWATPLTRQQLDVLTDAGLYERRVERRTRIALEVPAWPELAASSGVVPVRIIDLSSGGCCVRSPVGVAVGQRLMVHVWSEQLPLTAVRMRVRWQQTQDGVFLLGCAFTQRSGFSALSSVISKPPGAAQAGISLRKSRNLRAARQP